MIPPCRPPLGPPRSLVCYRDWTPYVGTTRRHSTIGERCRGAASRLASSRLPLMELPDSGSPVPRRGGPAVIGCGQCTSVQRTCPPLASPQTRWSLGGAGEAAAPMRPCATSCRPALWPMTPASGATTPWPRRSPPSVGGTGRRSWRSPTCDIGMALCTNPTLWFSAPPMTPSSAMSRSPGKWDQVRPRYGIVSGRYTTTPSSWRPPGGGGLAWRSSSCLWWLGPGACGPLVTIQHPVPWGSTPT
jgi:hypothetical protein